jgi:hypothetical protein
MGSREAEILQTQMEILIRTRKALEKANPVSQAKIA